VDGPGEQAGRLVAEVLFAAGDARFVINVDHVLAEDDDVAHELTTIVALSHDPDAMATEIHALASEQHWQVAEKATGTTKVINLSLG
jgi:hypothetical protein